MKHILAHKYIPMHFSVGLSFLGLLLLSLVSSTIIGVPHRAQAACAVPSTNYGAATATVTVPSDATYKIWSRIMAPDTSNNSYRLEIDGGTCYAVGNSAITANSWTWVDYQNGTTASKTTARLAAGQHTVKMIGVEPGVKVDRLLFVADQSCIPTGLGNNCLEQSQTPTPTPTPTPNPTPTPTNPNGQVSVPFRMNVGGGQYTDKYGTVWAADTYATGGQTNNQAAGKSITGAEGDDRLYQDEHWGMTSYNIPVTNGNYVLALHFAEIYAPCNNKQGCRVFSVTAEGKPILTDFDIVKSSRRQLQSERPVV